MDHRISKDMISNGMTPSGQRSQQDLSRTQYGSAATPASLAETYKKISEMTAGSDPGQAAQTSEYRRRALERERKQKMNPDGTPRKPEKVKVGLPRPGAGLLNREHADLFDIVKGHLMSEHECSEDIAIQLMTLLDEETKEDIMEYTAAIRADAAPKGTTMKMTADGKEPAGDKLLRGIRDRVGGFLQRLNPKAMKSTTVEPRKPLVATPKNEAYVVTNADKMGNTKAYQNFKAGMKNKLTGKPLYVAAPHLKGV